ncbi:MAG: hypothetical protein KDB88_06610 [Flavobacteriales bacterium]|nr:hypothetical protein [Flavobacteriales bacterium]
MKTRLITFGLALSGLLLFTCGLRPFTQEDKEQVVEHTATTQAALADLGYHDLVQRTCALFVGLRTRALGGAPAFGVEVEDTMVSWNKCPGGTMVACKKVPTADGDTLITGLVFP